MKYAEMPAEKRAEIEAWVKRRYAEKGFDPDDGWAWYRRLRDGGPLTIRELQVKVLAEAARRGWLAEANLESPPQPVSAREDFPLLGCDWDVRAWPNFGGSEGIYVDFELTLFLPGGKADRIRLGCGKTLDEDLGGMERMGTLCGRLLWLYRELGN